MSVFLALITHWNKSFKFTFRPMAFPIGFVPLALHKSDEKTT